VELHPLLQQVRLVRYAQSLGIHVTAFSPLGHGESYFGNPVSSLNEPDVQSIAKRLGKPIMFRYNSYYIQTMATQYKKFKLK